MSDDKVYQELALTWRHFASWREKILAGYLAVLAALGVAFTRSPSPVIRVTIFAGAILVSLVFWLLDFRNGQLLNACQIAAAALEGDNKGFSVLNETRFGASKWWASYGFAIDVLVGGVLGASGGGAYVLFSRLPLGAVGWVAPAIVVGAFFLFVLASQGIRNRQWKADRASSKT